jgi:hypothetical protein
MIKQLHFFIYLFLIYLVSISASADFLYKSFDESMHPPQGFDKNHIYSFIKKIYEERNPQNSKVKTINSIPKTIHQIWLGPKQISSEYLANSQRWKNLHPNWEYKLWREKDLEGWNFESKDLFNKASSYQEKSDILRYEILNKHGGLYVDMDYKPLKNFDDIHEKYSFYGSIEPLLSKKQNLTIANSIIASAPNNIIFYESLKRIRAHWNNMEELFRKEANQLRKEKDLIHLAVNRTMMPFNQTILDNIDKMDNAILFPTSYMSIEEKDFILKSLRVSLGLVSHKLYQRTPKEETMAVQKRGKRLITNLSNIKIQDPWYRKFIKKFT